MIIIQNMHFGLFLYFQCIFEILWNWKASILLMALLFLPLVEFYFRYATRVICSFFQVLHCSVWIRGLQGCRIWSRIKMKSSLFNIVYSFFCYVIPKIYEHILKCFWFHGNSWLCVHKIVSFLMITGFGTKTNFVFAINILCAFKFECKYKKELTKWVKVQLLFHWKRRKAV